MTTRAIFFVGCGAAMVAIAFACSSDYAAGLDEPIDSGRDGDVPDDGVRIDSAPPDADDADAGSNDACAGSLWCFQDDFDNDPVLASFQTAPATDPGATLGVIDAGGYSGCCAMRAHVRPDAGRLTAMIVRNGVPIDKNGALPDTRARTRASRQPAPPQDGVDVLFTIIGRAPPTEYRQLTLSVA